MIRGRPAPCPLTVHEALERAVTLAPDVDAIVVDGERLTFAELDHEVARIRAALAASGVERGDHVGICLPNSPRWMALFVAVVSLGAVAVPVNTRFRAEEMAYVLRQSRVRLLITADRFLRSEFVQMLRAICPGVEGTLPDPALPDLRHLVVVGDDVPAAATPWNDFVQTQRPEAPPVTEPGDIAIIQYTSGTTSDPKGVLLRNRSICADGFFSGSRMGLRVADRLHSVRPFFHVAGTTLSIVACLQHAATLVTMQRFEAGRALEVLETEACTHISCNDTIALMLLNHPDRPLRRLALRGGWAAASPTVVRRIVEELGARECVVGYGLSEASPNVAQSCWWEDEDLRISGRMLPQPGVDIMIREPLTGRVMPAGDIGEICVRGWNVMVGYFDKPAETAAVLDDDGWLATGDLGRLGADGRLVFAGRLKDIIRVGGENVSSAEVEEALHAHPTVRQAAVVAVPDARLIEVPFAFVVLREGASADPAAILDWLQGRLAGFKVPRYLDILEDFESIGMTASSKVQKTRLVARAAKRVAERSA